MNGYDLTRNWFNFKFDNMDKVKAIHTDFYLYTVDQWNRLGQKSSFGLPTSFTMQSLGIGSYNTYKKILQDLIDFGFIILVKESKNQHQSKLIALSKSDKAIDKALDKATIKAHDKATDSIDKQYNNLTSKQINNILAHANSLSKSELILFIDSLYSEKIKEEINHRQNKFKESLRVYLSEYGKDMLNYFFLYWTEHGENDKKMRFEKQTSFDIKRRLDTWKKNDKKFTNGKPTITTGTQKPKFRGSLQKIAEQYQQAENGNTEGELFEDTEYTEVE